MAHGSVVTLLTRLEAKNLVLKEKGPVGKALVYSVTETVGKVIHNALHQFLCRMYAGDCIQFVTSIFDIKPPDEKQLKDLQKLVADLKAKRLRSE